MAMTNDLVPIHAELVRAKTTGPPPPAIVERAGAGSVYEEFFLARFDNEHTRRAYRRHVSRFLNWCGECGQELKNISPSLCARFRDEYPGSVAQKKQMLSALRGFFDLMVERHFCLLNPASSTRSASRSIQSPNTWRVFT